VSKRTTHKLARLFTATIDAGIFGAFCKEAAQSRISKSLLIEQILSKRYGIEPKLRPADPRAAKLLNELEARKNAEIAALKAEIEALRATQPSYPASPTKRVLSLSDNDDRFTLEKG
jgi:hypothetical protein